MAAGVITEIAGGSITTSTAGDLSLYAQNVDLAASDRVNWKGEDNGVNLGTDPKDADEAKVLVKTAYFAKKVERKVKTVETQDHTVKARDTHASIAKSVPGVHAKELKAVYPKLKPGETVTLKVHGEKKEVTLERIKSGVIGARVALVVETFGLKGAEITVQILGSNNTFVNRNEAATVLEGGAEKNSFTAKVGAFAENSKYTNAANFGNSAVVEVELKPKAPETLKDWRKKIGESTEKRAFLYFTVKASATAEVLYYSDDVANAEPAKDKGVYLNAKTKWFELYACYCNRDITEDEVKEIVKEMRESEGRSSTALFGASNCPLPTDDKTYARLAEELNSVFTKYHIETCVRKLHFFAQIFWEGDRLQTTLEYSCGDYLDPGQHKDAEANGHTKVGDGPRYKGRGLMQLTWRDTQKAYFNNILASNPALLDNKTIAQLLDRGEAYEETCSETSVKVVGGKKVRTSKKRVIKCDSAALIARDLFFAVDSAGWFWDVYKKSRAGHNLNYYADYGDEYTDFISTLVNGGGNGKPERKVYYERLRDNIFRFKDTCVNYDKVKKKA